MWEKNTRRITTSFPLKGYPERSSSPWAAVSFPIWSFVVFSHLICRILFMIFIKNGDKTLVKAIKSLKIFFSASWGRQANKQTNKFTFRILKNFHEILLLMLPIDLCFHKILLISSYIAISVLTCMPFCYCKQKNLQKVIWYMTTWRSSYDFQYNFVWPLVKDPTVARSSLS